MNRDNFIFHRYSIKTRLTVFYGLTTMLLLLITTLFFYLTTLHILHHANQQFLSDEIRILQKVLRNQPENLLTLRQKVIDSSYMEPDSEYRYYVRILDEQHHVLLQTPFFNNALGEAVFLNQPEKLPQKQIIHWRSSTHPFVLMQAKSHACHAEKTVFVQVALDITYQQHVLNYYGKWLVLTLFSILFLAIGIGYWIASRATRTLKRLTKTAKDITVSSLHQRIDPDRWPKELHSLGLAFNGMLARIENAVTHLTQFSADLAHELRTPVNNLMGETEIVLSRTHTIEEYREVLFSHLEELQRLSQIIENILFLARTENPRLDIKKEPVSVKNEITLIAEFYQAMMDEKNMHFSLEGDATLRVNVIMFQRLLSNILSNAIKYTPEGGTIQFTVKTEDDLVEITLQDNGIGISPPHLPNLFNRFYRVDSARARKAGGVGLGLSIVKSIVELHQGMISMTSELDKGTRVVIVLPVDKLK
ncbi:MAG TPA: heavy metal sensor histidine kinase [Gammaproteobacteria bacterium]|nr:heavy metal sensor histidine kinase [Gammaproteobacteria bacterium]